MNNPEDMPLDADELVAWLKAHKETSGFSWAALAKETDIPHGTLSTLLTGKYTGNLGNQAVRIFRYRQKVESQQERRKSALSAPAYVVTPTSRRIQFLLEVAQMGRITVAATGPGTSKTTTAQHYAASVANVWVATMRQTHKSSSAMIAQVMRAMRLTSSSGWVQQRSDQVAEFVRDRGGLLVIDEANHLTLESLEEIRGWHDATKVGVALLGNEELLMRIRGGQKRHAYARLNSRIAQCHIQDMPTEGDAAAYLDAMDIDEPAIRRQLTDVALSPGHGGLREIQQILESANMLSIADDQALTLQHVQEAMRTRTTQHLRRAA